MGRKVPDLFVRTESNDGSHDDNAHHETAMSPQMRIFKQRQEESDRPRFLEGSLQVQLELEIPHLPSQLSPHTPPVTCSCSLVEHGPDVCRVPADRKHALGFQSIQELIREFCRLP